MTLPVYLDDDRSFRTEKVHDKRSDRLLASELESPRSLPKL